MKSKRISIGLLFMIRQEKHRFMPAMPDQLEMLTKTIIPLSLRMLGIMILQCILYHIITKSLGRKWNLNPLRLVKMSY